MVGRDAAVLGREAERHGNVKIRERFHLPVEPGERMRPETVSPRQAGTQMFDAEPLEPGHGLFQPVILEMKPLANANPGRPAAEMLRGKLRCSVLAQHAHGKMAVVGGALCFSMARRRRPCARQVIEAVPVNARGAADEKLSGAVQSPALHLLCAETRNANLRYPHRQICNGLDFRKLCRPFVDLPKIPVKRKSMHGDHIDVLQDTLACHVENETWIYWRNAAEHARQTGIFHLDRLPCGNRS